MDKDSVLEACGGDFGSGAERDWKTKYPGQDLFKSKEKHFLFVKFLAFTQD